MNYHKLIPLFGNSSATKFYLNRKFQGEKNLENKDWEIYGSMVKDYHQKNNLDIKILSGDLSNFEKKIIQENFKVFNGNQDITDKSSEWKFANKIIPYQTFHQDKIIYQGYNKLYQGKKKMNLKNLKNEIQGGGGNLENDLEILLNKNNEIKNSIETINTLNKNNKIFNNNIITELKLLFLNLYKSQNQLADILIKLDEYYEIIKNDDINKPIKILDSAGNLILDQEIQKEKALREKLKTNQKTLGLFFQKFGIYDLSKYGIFI